MGTPSTTFERFQILRIIFWLLAAGYLAGLAITAAVMSVGFAEIFLANNLHTYERGYLTFYVSLSICILSALSSAFIFRKTACNNATLHITRNIHALQAIALTGAVYILLDKRLWAAAPFAMYGALLTCSVCGYAIFSSLSVGCSRTQSKVLSTAIFTGVVVLATAIGIYFSYYTMMNHWKFGTLAFDLGHIQNAMTNTLRGDFMQTSVLGGRSFLSIHFAIITLFCLPFFAVFPSGETLLVLQSCILSLSAIPLYWFASKVLKDSIASGLLCAVYLLHPVHHTALFHDVNELASLSVCFFLLMGALESNRRGLFVLATLLTLAVKNDIPYLILPVGIFAWIRTGRIFYPAVLVGCAVAWLFISSWALTSLGGDAHGFVGYFEGTMMPGVTGVRGVLATLILNPGFVVLKALSIEKILYFLLIFSPFLFLPLMSLRSVLFVVYGLVVLVASSHPPIYSTHYQYVWYLLPTAMVATVYTLEERCGLKREPELLSHRNSLRGFLAAILVTTFVLSWNFGGIFNRSGFRNNTFNFAFTPDDAARLAAFHRIVSRIPANSSVSADESIGPHLNTFSRVSTLRYFQRDAQFILVWRYSGYNAERLSLLVPSVDFELVSEDGPFQLYQRTLSE